MLWIQIENAARATGKPWSPRHIMQKLHLDNAKAFGTLTEQVIGRWMDCEAKKHGESKWKDSVLKNIAKGNAPGGHTTRSGLLVSGIVSDRESDTD
jgi:hypothetical protein